MISPKIEGNWYAVPLADNDYVLSLVARSKRSGVALVYVFGTRLVHPTIDDARKLTTIDAILVAITTGEQFRECRWPLLGKLSWNRNDWPIPNFGGGSGMKGESGKGPVHIYNDDLQEGKVILTDQENEKGEWPWILYGGKALRIKVTEQIGGIVPQESNKWAIPGKPATYFFIRFTREDFARNAADSLSDRGYRYRIERSNPIDEDTWFCVIETDRDINIMKVGREIKHIVRPFQGSLQNWEQSE